MSPYKNSINFLIFYPSAPEFHLCMRFHTMILIIVCSLQRLLSIEFNLKLIFSVNKCVQSKGIRKRKRASSAWKGEGGPKRRRKRYEYLLTLDKIGIIWGWTSTRGEIFGGAPFSATICSHLAGVEFFGDAQDWATCAHHSRINTGYVQGKLILPRCKNAIHYSGACANSSSNS